jgi:hypothetical protein
MIDEYADVLDRMLVTRRCRQPDAVEEPLS